MTCIVIAVCKLQADTLSATLVHCCCLKHDLSNSMTNTACPLSARFTPSAINLDLDCRLIFKAPTCVAPSNVKLIYAGIQQAAAPQNFGIISAVSLPRSCDLQPAARWSVVPTLASLVCHVSVSLHVAVAAECWEDDQQPSCCTACSRVSSCLPRCQLPRCTSFSAGRRRPHFGPRNAHHSWAEPCTANAAHGQSGRPLASAAA